MLTIQECRRYLKQDISDKRVEEIRDYLQALSKEIIKKSVDDYKKSLVKITKHEQT
jgi:transcriptional regulator of heat shock response